jgi:hypothetical protein
MGAATRLGVGAGRRPAEQRLPGPPADETKAPDGDTLGPWPDTKPDLPVPGTEKGTPLWMPGRVYSAP